MLDLNDGLTRRRLSNGSMISMVKTKPGVWYDDNGEVVALEVARDAGFDVAILLLEQAKQDRLKKALALVEAQFAETKAAVEAGALLDGPPDEDEPEPEPEPEPEEEPEEDPVQAKKVDRRSEPRHRMVFAGKGLFRVKAPDGSALSDALPRAEAEAIYKQVTAAKAEAA